MYQIDQDYVSILYFFVWNLLVKLTVENKLYKYNCVFSGSL